MPTCLACDIVAGRIIPPGGTILENDAWMVSHMVAPCVLKGYLIVNVKRHCESFSDLNYDEQVSLGPLLGRVSRGLEELLMPQRIHIASYNESIHHIHFHIIPRPQGAWAGSLPFLFQLRLWRLMNQLGLRPWVSHQDASQFATELHATLSQSTLA